MRKIAFWLVCNVRMWFVPRWLGAYILGLAFAHANANRVVVTTPAPSLQTGQKRLRIIDSTMPASWVPAMANRSTTPREREMLKAAVDLNNSALVASHGDGEVGI